jgi:uncharacterized protein YaaW (UPF0174 family)
MPLITDPDLSDLLMEAEIDDLGVLVDHITDKGEGRISLASATCDRLAAAKKTGMIPPVERALIAEELCRFGGNSLMNLFRKGGGVSYHEITCDVASHLKAKYSPNADVAAIELAILEKLAEQSLEKMTEQEKEAFFNQFGMRYAVGSGAGASAGLLAGIIASQTASYELSAIIANGVAKALLGRGLAAGLGTMSGAAMVAPVALVLTVLWGLYGLTSPAYRVTVPCVIHLAYMRRKRVQSAACRQCGVVPAAGARFCSGCGAALGAVPLLARNAGNA